MKALMKMEQKRGEMNGSYCAFWTYADSISHILVHSPADHPRCQDRKSHTVSMIKKNVRSKFDCPRCRWEKKRVNASIRKGRKFVFEGYYKHRDSSVIWRCYVTEMVIRRSIPLQLFVIYKIRLPHVIWIKKGNKDNLQSVIYTACRWRWTGL